MMRCPTCGMVFPEGRFCPVDGQGLVAAPNVPPAEPGSAPSRAAPAGAPVAPPPYGREAAGTGGGRLGEAPPAAPAGFGVPPKSPVGSGPHAAPPSSVEVAPRRLSAVVGAESVGPRAAAPVAPARRVPAATDAAVDSPAIDPVPAFRAPPPAPVSGQAQGGSLDAAAAVDDAASVADGAVGSSVEHAEEDSASRRTPAGAEASSMEAGPIREITEEVRNGDATIGDASVQSNKQQKDTSASLAGTVLEGRYELVDVIGAGGMGIVYRARHLAIGNDLAIKVLRSPLVADNQIATRFLQEARFASSIRHPNVVPIFDYGEAPNGAPYYVMDMLRGKTLGDAIDESALGSIAEIIELGIQIGEGLKAAHTVNIIHRDLKPDNIFLEPSAEGKTQAKIIDFGIARLQGSARRLTLEGAVVGTPAYMGPEQARGMPVDFRTDLYAVGVMLFEMLTGRLPFQAKNSMAALASQVYERPPTLSQIKMELKPYRRLEAIVERLLEKDPSSRVQSASELVSLLRGLDDEVAAGQGARPRPEKDTVSMGSGDLINPESDAAAAHPDSNTGGYRGAHRRADKGHGGLESTFPPADTYAPGGELGSFVERDSDVELEKNRSSLTDDSMYDAELEHALGIGPRLSVPWVTRIFFGVFVVAATTVGVKYATRSQHAESRPSSAVDHAGSRSRSDPAPTEPEEVPAVDPDTNRADLASGETTAATDANDGEPVPEEDLAEPAPPGDDQTTEVAPSASRGARGGTSRTASRRSKPKTKPAKQRSGATKPNPLPSPSESVASDGEPPTQVPSKKEKPPAVSFDDLKDPFS